MAAARRGRKQKSSPASALEASLEMLYEVSTSLNKKKTTEKSDFVYSFDGSGARGPSKYGYRSVADRASGRSSKCNINAGEYFVSTISYK